MSGTSGIGTRANVERHERRPRAVITEMDSLGTAREQTEATGTLIDTVELKDYAAPW